MRSSSIRSPGLCQSRSPSRLAPRALPLVLAGLLGTLSSACDPAAGGSGGVAKASLLGDTLEYGVIWSFTFDASNAPVIGTQSGAFRWDGTTWVAYPATPAEEVSEVVVTGSGALVVNSKGAVLRLSSGATQWEELANSTLKLSRLVAASDGTLYAIQDKGPTSSTMRVHYRGAADTSWTDSNVDVSVFCYPLADSEGNIWCESSETLEVKRINKSTVESFPKAYGFTPTLGHVVKTVQVDDKGSHWGMSHNYSNAIGEMWEWNPGKSLAPTLRVEGTKCTDGDESTLCAGAAQVTGYITSPTRAPNGDGYQLWAPQNGASPYLMHVKPGGTWTVIGDLRKHFVGAGVARNSGVNPAAVSLRVDQKGQLFAFGSRLDPGALKGGSVVLKLDR